MNKHERMIGIPVRKRGTAHLTLQGLVVFLVACSLVLGMPRTRQRARQGDPVSSSTPSQSLVKGSGTKQSGSHSDCMSCHSIPNLVAEFANGDQMSLTIDPDAHLADVHGSRLNCVTCHTDQRAYPHDPAVSNCQACHLEAAGRPRAPRIRLAALQKRVFVLSMNDSCHKCHAEQFETLTDSAHTELMKRGNDYAPTCVDCHRSFNQLANPTPHDAIGEMCSQCHLAIYTSYRSSVHGPSPDSASDAPTCTSCHGVHSVRGPSDPQFHNDIPMLCGKCHANADMMSKYGISTDVFQTYEADFHGKSVASFRLQDSNLPSDRAVCTDCHSTHNIRRVDDPKSTVMQENLLETCRRCHKEASFSFPAAWLGHQSVTAETQPVLFGVNQLYQILAAVVGVACVAYIGLDAQRRWRVSRREKKNGK